MVTCSRCTGEIINVRTFELNLKDYDSDYKETYRLCESCAEGVVRFIERKIWFDTESTDEERKEYGSCRVFGVKSVW